MVTWEASNKAKEYMYLSFLFYIHFMVYLTITIVIHFGLGAAQTLA